MQGVVREQSEADGARGRQGRCQSGSPGQKEENETTERVFLMKMFQNAFFSSHFSTVGDGGKGTAAWW